MGGVSNNACRELYFLFNLRKNRAQTGGNTARQQILIGALLIIGAIAIIIYLLVSPGTAAIVGRPDVWDSSGPWDTLRVINESEVRFDHKLRLAAWITSSIIIIVGAGMVLYGCAQTDWKEVFGRG